MTEQLEQLLTFGIVVSISLSFTYWWWNLQQHIPPELITSGVVHKFARWKLTNKDGSERTYMGFLSKAGPYQSYREIGA